MRRVLVIGCGGAGKSTFATRLAALTGLPFAHLDALYWQRGWIEPSKELWAQTVERLAAAEQWIKSGDPGSSGGSKRCGRISKRWCSELMRKLKPSWLSFDPPFG